MGPIDGNNRTGRDGSGSDCVLSAINGRYFENYARMEESAAAEFIKHFEKFPAHYTLHDLLDFAENEGWIQLDTNMGVWIIYDPQHSLKRFTVVVEIEVAASNRIDALQQVREVCAETRRNYFFNAAVKDI